MKIMLKLTAVAVIGLTNQAFATSYTLTNGETRTLIDGGHRYYVPDSASVTLKQNSTSQIKATISLGAGATVTLNGINVKGYFEPSSGSSSTGEANAISCEGNATIILVDGTTNTLNGGKYIDAPSYNHPHTYAAIKAGPSGTTLTIKGGISGTGKLIATGGAGDVAAPGIGADYVFSAKSYCGNIVIEGGDITAKTDDGKGVGIGASGSNGGSYYSTCGDITIKDSITKVVARIGAISPSSCGTITIGSHLNQSISNNIRTLTPMMYSVVFDVNGGDGDNIIKSFRYGSTQAIGVLPLTSRTGYSFSGWYSSKDGGQRITEDAIVSNATTFYAHWTANKHAITFDANGGEGGTSMTRDYDATIGNLPEPTREGYMFLGWYSARDGGERVTEESVVQGDATYYAHWVAAPYEFSGDADWSVQLDGSWKSGVIGDGQTSSMEMKVSGKQRVSFRWKCSCEPLIKGKPYDYLSFAIDGVQQEFICGETDWTDVVFDIRSRGTHSLRWTYIKDEDGAAGEDCGWVADVLVTEIPPETFGEFLNCPGRTFTTGGDANWSLAQAVSADGYALRSGDVGNSQTSRLETVVYGAGMIEFRCKVDGEVVKKIVFDGLAFCIDGVQQGDLMGENAWTDKSFAVTGDGRHTLSWLYVKDEDGSGGGEDRAWLDNVVWTASDALPALDGAATDNDAKAIIAGLSDVRLSDEIGGTAAYTTFRSWVDNNSLSHVVVKDAPNVWLSYALDAPGLMAKATALANEDVVIESIEPSSAAEALELVVNIADAEIGESARIAEALGVEGATELKESAFSSEGLSVTFDRTSGGKAKATVTPDGAPPTFFLRVKVK